MVKDPSDAPAAKRTRAVDITELMLASRAIAAVIVRSLATVDPAVSPTQMRILVLLWSGRELNLTSIAKNLGVNSSNASRTCERLVSSGLLARSELVGDRRQRMFTLTARGHDLVAALLARREAELTSIVARMSDSDQSRLMQALAPFNRAAHADLWPGLPFAGRDAHLLEWDATPRSGEAPQTPRTRER